MKKDLRAINLNVKEEEQGEVHFTSFIKFSQWW